MELRNLAVLLGLCLLAVSQCSEARHSMHRRGADDDIFAADEASDDEGTQNDEFENSDSKPESQYLPPPVQAVITTKPKLYEVRPGTDLKLECNVNPDNATVVVQWYKNNDLYFMNTIKLSDGNDRYSIASDSKDLVISNVEASDSGTFRCELVQDNPVSIEHNVVVLSSPTIVKFTATNEGNVREGQDLLLTCDARGKPPPQIVWSRAVENGNQRLGEQDGEFSVNSVFIKNVRREHSGKYYCYAFNTVGHNQAELQVQVSGKPRVHVHKHIINSAINVEAILQCSAHYEANPHIRWYKDGKLIENTSSDYSVSTHGTHSNLTVTPTSDADFGTFTCEAENAFGRHNKSIELVQRPIIESLGAESGRLSWIVQSHQPLQEMHAQLHLLSEEGETEWKQFEVPLPSTQGHRQEIIFDLNDKQLDAGKYEAFIKVKNDHSWSDNTDPIVFDIEVEPQYIQHASVYRGNGAVSMRPTSTILSTIIMYLLVRLL